MNVLTDSIDSLFAGFEGRKTDLQIPRYNMYEPMFYRTTVYDHTIRLDCSALCLQRELLTVFPDLDFLKLRLLLQTHDDIEIVVTDVQAVDKDNMDESQKAELKGQEQAAIKVLTKRFPKIVGDYCYRDLLLESWETTSLEAQIVKLLDKWDAYGEALHELFAGNQTFATCQQRSYGPAELPFTLLPRTIAKIFQQFPVLKSLQQINYWMFHVPTPIDIERVVGTGQSHSLISLARPTGYPPYDGWLRMIQQSYGGQFPTWLYEKSPLADLSVHA